MMCCYVRYLLKSALKSNAKHYFFLIISAIGIDITETYDDTIGLR